MYESSARKRARLIAVPSWRWYRAFVPVIRAGMSTAGGRKTVRWTYLPAPADPSTITTLTFELGRLVEVERKVIRAP